PRGMWVAVHPAVVKLTSLERFGAVERPDLGIHTALRRLFQAVAAAFGAGGRLAVAAGGDGDTDRASDLAWTRAGVIEVWGCLEAVIGSPARSGATLEGGSCGWYLSALDTEPSTAADGGGR